MGQTANSRLFAGLAKSRSRIADGLDPGQIDQFLVLLEERLLLADCGPRATVAALMHVRGALQKTGAADGPAVKRALREFVAETVRPLEQPMRPEGRPFVLMMAGVNGGGKTTTIAKLAHRLAKDGARVRISTSDTFRAAAREQIAEWARRLGEHVEFADLAGGNPSGVAFDAVTDAVAKGSDILIIDTAGRLPTQANLMRELEKTKRVIGKALPGAPHETMLVLDATNGRNAVTQLQAFDEAIGVSGLTVTKLDGTAKGGAILAIAMEQPKPIRYVGVGEGMEDLLDFEANVFASALVMPPA